MRTAQNSRGHARRLLAARMRATLLPALCLQGMLLLVVCSLAGRTVAEERHAASAGASLLPAGVTKVDRWIELHRQMKLPLRQESVAAWQQRLLGHGLSFAQPHAEEVALYVERELTPGERAGYGGLGIEIHPTVYVRPIEGRHPFGFHLAIVPYAAIDALAIDPRIVRVQSVEFMAHPYNNMGNEFTNAAAVHAGDGVVARDGTGVRVAIADSGIDLTHDDFPVPAEAYDVTDGFGPGSWGLDVSNTVTPHGTHVAGSVLGRGTLSDGNSGNGGGAYKGGAPGADLYFYKIGNDFGGGATFGDIIEAIDRAAEVGCDVFTMSYGGFASFLDGSGTMEQAVDNAFEDGMFCCFAAGNEGGGGQYVTHTSVEVGAGADSEPFTYSIDNRFGSSTYTGGEYVRIVWIDGEAGDGNISLRCDNLGGGESLTLLVSDSSPRGTEGKDYLLSPAVPAGGLGSYELVIENDDSSSDDVRVHLYRYYGYGSFDEFDSSTTVMSPAVADHAAAVGAWVSRASWTNYTGASYTFGQTSDTLASFSSRGPRIDGVVKPDFCAPGTATISVRDTEYSYGLTTNGALIVDNDGAALDGSGPADYYALQGTSMASPTAAGAIALLFEAAPDLTPAQAYEVITATAAFGGAPDDDAGHGPIDIRAAIDACIDGDLCAGLYFEFPDGMPEFLNLDGTTTFRLLVLAGNAAPADDTARVYYATDAAGPYTSLALERLDVDEYRVEIPAGDCGDTVRFYFAAEDSEGVEVLFPSDGADAAFALRVAYDASEAFLDDFDYALDWTVGADDDEDDATAGLWQRARPGGDGAEPDQDHGTAGNGWCWVTGPGGSGGAGSASSVRDGKTTLESPRLDMRLAGDYVVGFWLWYSNSSGSNPAEDSLVVEVSAEDGADGSWVIAQTVGPSGAGTTGGWAYHAFDVGDSVEPGPDVRVRFVVSDEGGESIVEAALDDFRVRRYLCARDCNGNDIADSIDLERGTSEDCNSNANPDECDARSGVRMDEFVEFAGVEDSRLGASVAISGDVVVLGEPGDIAGGSGRGVARVLRAAGAAWEEEALLAPLEGEADDEFGMAVAAHGERIAVGAHRADALGPAAGRIHVFRWLGGEWRLEEELYASDGAAGDLLGGALAMGSAPGGEWIVAGAPNDDDAATNSGAAYVFRRTDGGWQEIAKLVGSDLGAVDRFGSAVAIDGELIAVGAPVHQQPGSAGGAVYLFRFDGVEWIEEAVLTSAVAGDSRFFGTAVAVSGDAVAVGATGDDAFGGETGAVHLFRREAGVWSEEAFLAANPGFARDRFGASVALRGDLLVVGAPGSDGIADDAGGVYAFRHEAGEWRALVEPRTMIEDTSGLADWSGARVGEAVALGSGGVIVCGAPGWRDGAGALDDAGAALLLHVADCDGDDTPDACELTAGTAEDCNDNGVPDDCEVGLGLEIVSHPEPVGVQLGSALRLEIVVAGFPQPQYQWRLDGADLPGADAAVYEVASAGLDDQGSYSVVVSNDCASVTSDSVEVDVDGGDEYLRGDANGDGSVVTISDIIYLLAWGFTEGPAPPCLAAADCDGNGAVNTLVDVFYLLDWQFSGGDAPPTPGPTACGAAGSLPCADPPESCE